MKIKRLFDLLMGVVGNGRGSAYPTQSKPRTILRIRSAIKAAYTVAP